MPKKTKRKSSPKKLSMSHKPDYSKFVNRLRRIEGQVRGVEKMVEQGKSSKEVMTQVDAIISSLQSAKMSFVKERIKAELMAEMAGVLDLIE